jgi:hypothetical protein
MDHVTPAMLIASEIVKAHPHTAEDLPLLRSILDGLRRAIMDERAACQSEAEKFVSGETANRPEYTDVEVAARFAMKAVAVNVSDAISERGKA